MDDIRVSVCMSTYNRAHLLARSLICYENQQFDNDKFELVVVDDSSTDDTHRLVKDWSDRTGIRSTVLTPYPKRTGWRDCAATINHGIRVSQGRIILLTHPEILPGKTSVLDCVEKLEEFEGYTGPMMGKYACCRSYYLSPDDQRDIDTVDWKGKGAIAVRDIKNFYEQEQVPEWRGHPDFSHKATDIVGQPGSRLPTWESLIFGGMSRETWKRLGGVQRTEKWGSIDVLFMQRRFILGIPNYTCPSESAIVCHQNHDLPGDDITPRIEQVWKDELKKINLSDPSKLIWPNVDEIGWGG